MACDSVYFVSELLLIKLFKSVERISALRNIRFSTVFRCCFIFVLFLVFISYAICFFFVRRLIIIVFTSAHYCKYMFFRYYSNKFKYRCNVNFASIFIFYTTC